MTNTYWDSNGAEQAKYDEMLNAGWDDDMMLKATVSTFHSYYRYYNDGDLPGWARGKHEFIKPSYEYGYFHFVLNERGEQAFEARITEAILKEYKRFQKAQGGQS